jgi:hypothetical protein
MVAVSASATRNCRPIGKATEADRRFHTKTLSISNLWIKTITVSFKFIGHIKAYML